MNPHVRLFSWLVCWAMKSHFQRSYQSNQITCNTFLFNLFQTYKHLINKILYIGKIYILKVGTHKYALSFYLRIFKKSTNSKVSLSVLPFPFEMTIWGHLHMKVFYQYLQLSKHFKRVFMC